jgi:phage terminase small subunit
MTVSLKNALALREAAETLAAVVNDFLEGIRGKFLASPAWLSTSEGEFRRLAPALDALRKLTDETRQVLERNASFLSQHSQTLAALRQGAAVFKQVRSALHTHDFGETRKLAVAAVDLLEAAVAAVHQAIQHTRDISADRRDPPGRQAPYRPS